MDTSKFTRGLGKTKLVLQKNSPEILLVVGIAAGLAGAYFAAKVTETARQRVEATKDEAVEIMEKTVSPEYTEADQQQELGMAVINGGLQVAKLYLPAIGFGVLSVSALLVSHGIMTKRVSNLSAAYAIAVESLTAYRTRVAEEFGEEADMMINRGVREVLVDDETSDDIHNGLILSDRRPNIYGALFDEDSREFRESYEMNLFFLQSQEKFANQMLRMQGHVFLNEIFDALGLPRTSVGAIVGWKYQYDPSRNNDTYIRFGIMNVENEPNGHELRKHNPRFNLDFNVDGEIYKLI